MILEHHHFVTGKKTEKRRRRRKSNCMKESQEMNLFYYETYLCRKEMDHSWKRKERYGALLYVRKIISSASGIQFWTRHPLKVQRYQLLLCNYWLSKSKQDSWRNKDKTFRPRRRKILTSKVVKSDPKS